MGSKNVLSVLTSIIFALLALSILFNGMAFYRYNNIACKNDAAGESTRSNTQISLILQCIGLFLLVFMFIYVMYWQYRKLRGPQRFSKGRSPETLYDYGQSAKQYLV